jgi:uncharacterized protein (TIGR00661 family)
MRAIPLVERLSAHYDVHLFCGGRVYDFLHARFPNVFDVYYVPLVYRDNRMHVRESFVRAWLGAPRCFRDAAWLWARALREGPTAVVSDYEFMTMWCGTLAGVPVVTVDNNQLARFAAVPPPRTDEERDAHATILTATKWNVPFAKRRLLTTFYRPPLLPGVDTGVVGYAPCAVRDRVLAARPRVRRDGPVVVYQTSTTNHGLGAALTAAAVQTGLRFHVYGAGVLDIDDARVVSCAFDDVRFVDDLAACPFVIINGGHSTLVEAIALQKPILCQPVRDHYEQTLNARGVEAAGVGRAVDDVTADAIVAFVKDAAGAFDDALAGAAAVVDNDGLAAAVDAAIKAVARR